MLQIGELSEGATRLGTLIKFVYKCLELNRPGQYYANNIEIVTVLVAMFENMPGKLDNDLPDLLSLLFDELMHQL